MEILSDREREWEHEVAGTEQEGAKTEELEQGGLVVVVRAGSCCQAVRVGARGGRDEARCTVYWDHLSASKRGSRDVFVPVLYIS